MQYVHTVGEKISSTLPQTTGAVQKLLGRGDQAATGEPAGPEAQSAQPVAPQTPTRPEDLTLTEAARLSGPAPTTNLRSDPGIVWGHKVSEGERAGGTLQLGQAGSVAGAAGGLSEGEAARASEGVNQSLTGMEQGAESRPMAEGQGPAKMADESIQVPGDLTHGGLKPGATWPVQPDGSFALPKVQPDAHPDTEAEMERLLHENEAPETMEGTSGIGAGPGAAVAPSHARVEEAVNPEGEVRPGGTMEERAAQPQQQGMGQGWAVAPDMSGRAGAPPLGPAQVQQPQGATQQPMFAKEPNIEAESQPLLQRGAPASEEGPMAFSEPDAGVKLEIGRELSPRSGPHPHESISHPSATLPPSLALEEERFSGMIPESHMRTVLPPSPKAPRPAAGLQPGPKISAPHGMHPSAAAALDSVPSLEPLSSAQQAPAPSQALSQGAQGTLVPREAVSQTGPAGGATEAAAALEGMQLGQAESPLSPPMMDPTCVECSAEPMMAPGAQPQGMQSQLQTGAAPMGESLAHQPIAGSVMPLSEEEVAAVATPPEWLQGEGEAQGQGKGEPEFELQGGGQGVQAPAQEAPLPSAPLPPLPQQQQQQAAPQVAQERFGVLDTAAKGLEQPGQFQQPPLSTQASLASGAPSAGASPAWATPTSGSLSSTPVVASPVQAVQPVGMGSGAQRIDRSVLFSPAYQVPRMTPMTQLQQQAMPLYSKPGIQPLEGQGSLAPSTAPLFNKPGMGGLEGTFTPSTAPLYSKPGIAPLEGNVQASTAPLYSKPGIAPLGGTAQTGTEYLYSKPGVQPIQPSASLAPAGSSAYAGTATGGSSSLHAYSTPGSVGSMGGTSGQGLAREGVIATAPGGAPLAPQGRGGLHITSAEEALPPPAATLPHLGEAAVQMGATQSSVPANTGRIAPLASSDPGTAVFTVGSEGAAGQPLGVVTPATVAATGTTSPLTTGIGAKAHGHMDMSSSAGSGGTSSLASATATAPSTTFGGEARAGRTMASEALPPAGGQITVAEGALASGATPGGAPATTAASMAGAPDDLTVNQLATEKSEVAPEAPYGAHSVAGVSQAQHVQPGTTKIVIGAGEGVGAVTPATVHATGTTSPLTKGAGLTEPGQVGAGARSDAMLRPSPVTGGQPLTEPLTSLGEPVFQDAGISIGAGTAGGVLSGGGSGVVGSEIAGMVQKVQRPEEGAGSPLGPAV